MKTEHTPTPWIYQKPRGPQHAISRDWEIVSQIDGGCEMVVVGEHTGCDSLKKRDAEFIVTACNSYDALADALRNILNGLRLGKDDDSPYWDATITNAESALKAAGVEL